MVTTPAALRAPRLQRIARHAPIGGISGFSIKTPSKPRQNAFTFEKGHFRPHLASSEIVRPAGITFPDFSVKTPSKRLQNAFTFPIAFSVARRRLTAPPAKPQFRAAFPRVDDNLIALRSQGAGLQPDPHVALPVHISTSSACARRRRIR